MGCDEWQEYQPQGTNNSRGAIREYQSNRLRRWVEERARVLVDVPVAHRWPSLRLLGPIGQPPISGFAPSLGSWGSRSRGRPVWACRSALEKLPPNRAESVCQLGRAGVQAILITALASSGEHRPGRM